MHKALTVVSIGYVEAVSIEMIDLRCRWLFGNQRHVPGFTRQSSKNDGGIRYM